jgi:SAM-dependent methyltransferase
MKVDSCRGCGSGALITLHDFGPQPLAGVYPTEPETVRAVRKYALDLTQCSACGLLQVVNLPPISEVFHEDYRYSSSTVPGLVLHFERYADWLIQFLKPGARVFEFGCNDGVLLERLARRGMRVTGLDASDNVASIARSKGLDVRTGFLTPDFATAPDLAHEFDLITCSNVFAHIHDLTAVLAAVRVLLASRGLFVIEVHDGDLLSVEGQFDTIYHEHLTYFSESTLRSLLQRSGFEFVLCERTPMHGGGLRLVARMQDASGTGYGEREVSILDDFIAPKVAQCGAELRRLRAAYGPLAGYGAAGRSQMFINFTGSAELFDVVYDDSPFRQDRYIAGTNVPIRPYAGQEGACLVILAWNYARDISARVGGRFGKILTLLPETTAW